MSLLSCTRICPHYAPVTKDSSDSWKITSVQKWYAPHYSTVVDYMEETATGDFYHCADSGPLVGIAASILLLAPAYCGLTMAGNLVSTAIDVAAVFFEFLSKKKGLKTAVVLPIFVLMPVLKGCWGIVRAPFYTVAMMVAAAYGLYNPYGARSWYNKIETHWHDGKNYTYDLRHHAKEEFDIQSVWKDYREGKIYFMVYCCLKRGNRTDNRFNPS